MGRSFKALQMAPLLGGGGDLSQGSVMIAFLFRSVPLVKEKKERRTNVFKKVGLKKERS